jgi:hypothetical protein
MMVTGTAGGYTGTADLILIVASAPPPSFTLSVSPTARVVEPGEVVSFTANVAGLSGFSYPVTLTVVGLPTGVGAAWEINPVTPEAASTLTLSTPSTLLSGDYPFYVVGMTESGAVVDSAKLSIDYPFKIRLPIILKWW